MTEFTVRSQVTNQGLILSLRLIRLIRLISSAPRFHGADYSDEMSLGVRICSLVKFMMSRLLVVKNTVNVKAQCFLVKAHSKWKRSRLSTISCKSESVFSNWLLRLSECQLVESESQAPSLLLRQIA